MVWSQSKRAHARSFISTCSLVNITPPQKQLSTGNYRRHISSFLCWFCWCCTTSTTTTTLCMHKRKTKRSSIGSQRGGLIKTKDWRLTQSFWFRRDVWLCFSVIKKNCCCCFSSNSSPSSFFRHPALFLVSFIKVAGCRRVAREKVSVLVLVCVHAFVFVCVCVTAREKGKKRAFRFESPLKLNCRSFENKKKQFRHFSILVLALVLATGIFNLLTS